MPMAVLPISRLFCVYQNTQILNIYTQCKFVHVVLAAAAVVVAVV